jgi:hypothetical protein
LGFSESGHFCAVRERRFTERSDFCRAVLKRHRHVSAVSPDINKVIILTGSGRAQAPQFSVTTHLVSQNLRPCDVGFHRPDNKGGVNIGLEVGRTQYRWVGGRIIQAPGCDSKQFTRSCAVREQTEFDGFRLAYTIGIAGYLEW